VAPRKRAAAIYNAPDQQVADQANTVAGRDIRQGADPALLARALAEMHQFLRDYTFSIDQGRETALKEIRRELTLLRGDRDVLTGTLNTLRDRVDDLVNDRERERVERRERQGVLNWWLGAICVCIALLAGAVAWLAWQVFAPPVDVAALLRLWLGAALALAAQLWRR
jgi:hypothetical protein